MLTPYIGSRALIVKACFPLAQFHLTNRETSNLIGWRQTLTSSPANHNHFLLARAKIANWKTSFTFNMSVSDPTLLFQCLHFDLTNRPEQKKTSKKIVSNIAAYIASSSI
jgi:hypothetical protein